MSALLPVVAVAAPAQTPFNLPLDNIPPTRAIRELMIDTLEDPRVQVKIGITPRQRMLMDLRLSKATLNYGLSMARQTYKGEDDEALSPMGIPFANSPAHALFPFLAEGQLGKLRRLTIAEDALGTLQTDEVAFAIDLTNAQRKALNAMRIRHLKAQMNPKSPAYKAAMAGFGELMALPKESGDSTDDAAAIARLDEMKKAFDRMFAHFERAVRLDATESHPKNPDALTLLTPVQRRRFRELSSGALAKPHALVAKKG